MIEILANFIINNLLNYYQIWSNNKIVLKYNKTFTNILFNALNLL